MRYRATAVPVELLITCCTLLGHTLAQFPRVSRNDTTTINSPVSPQIQVSFKSPPFGTCTTVFQTQKQYTGYVRLPPNVLSPTQGNYTINTFFWFIEARQLPETAPLTVFINGGPGSSSMVGLFQELGPCEVVEVASNKLATIPRDWGWDRSSNILFIDQPVQVGFSYDTLTSASLNLLNGQLTRPPTTVPPTQPPYTFLNGTFASGSSAATANTSALAAQVTWHFLQAWLSVFPQYNPGLHPDGSGDAVAGINLFTESYGGRFGPAMFSFFQTQNDLRRRYADFAANSLEIKLSSLGVMNGWIDLLAQMPFFPRFAYNNTYGIQTISQTQQLNALSAFNAVGGCAQLTRTCRSQQLALDPYSTGTNVQVGDACSAAQSSCEDGIIAPYFVSGRSIYDISQNVLDPFPNPRYLEYLNQADVQLAIGAPINYTQDSPSVFGAFNRTGDYARDGNIQDIVRLLQAGVRVALMYGDRDYICNWLGGEAVSLAIADAAGPTYRGFSTAGYTPIVTNNSFIGGMVREYGNLSFARVYDAGHLIPAYQPETAFTLFSRVIKGTGLSLGLPVNRANFGTTGPINTTHTNSAPAASAPTCHLRAMNSTCNTDQKNMIANRAGVLINGVLYPSSAAWSAPTTSTSTLSTGRTSYSSTSTTLPGSSTSSTRTIPTGVFTATGIPTSTSTSVAVPHARPKSYLDLEMRLDSPWMTAMAVLVLIDYTLSCV